MTARQPATADQRCCHDKTNKPFTNRVLARYSSWQLCFTVVLCFTDSLFVCLLACPFLVFQSSDCHEDCIRELRDQVRGRGERGDSVILHCKREIVLFFFGAVSRRIAHRNSQKFYFTEVHRMKNPLISMSPNRVISMCGEWRNYRKGTSSSSYAVC